MVDNNMLIKDIIIKHEGNENEIRMLEGLEEGVQPITSKNLLNFWGVEPENRGVRQISTFVKHLPTKTCKFREILVYFLKFIGVYFGFGCYNIILGLIFPK